MCDYDNLPGLDIDPKFFEDDKVPVDEPLYNPFYEPAPGENLENDFENDWNIIIGLQRVIWMLNEFNHYLRDIVTIYNEEHMPHN